MITLRSFHLKTNNITNKKNSQVKYNEYKVLEYLLRKRASISCLNLRPFLQPLFVSIETIALAVNLSVRTVGRIIFRLQRAGKIIKLKIFREKHGLRSLNCYFFHDRSDKYSFKFTTSFAEALGNLTASEWNSSDIKNIIKKTCLNVYRELKEKLVAHIQKKYPESWKRTQKRNHYKNTKEILQQDLLREKESQVLDVIQWALSFTSQ